MGFHVAELLTSVDEVKDDIRFLIPPGLCVCSTLAGCLVHLEVLSGFHWDGEYTGECSVHWRTIVIPCGGYPEYIWGRG